MNLPNEIIYYITELLPSSKINNMICTNKNISCLNLDKIFIEKKINYFILKSRFKKFKMNIYDLKIKNVTASFIQEILQNVLLDFQVGN